MSGKIAGKGRVALEGFLESRHINLKKIPFLIRDALYLD